MTLISKAAGGLSLFSCIRDIHKTAVIYSNNAYAKTASDSFIACDIGAQKADRISYKDAQRKNWLAQNNFLGGAKATIARIGGYLGGLFKGAVRYIPNLALGAAAMFSKNKHVANISAVGLAGLETYDFIKNSTSISQRTDYLK